MQSTLRSPNTLSPLCLWIPHMLLPFSGMPQLHLLSICLQTATCSPGLRTSTVSSFVPSLTPLPSLVFSLNLVLTSFIGIIRWHCNWLFPHLSLLRLWALGWQRTSSSGKLCGLHSTLLELRVQWLISECVVYALRPSGKTSSQLVHYSTMRLPPYFSFHLAISLFIKWRDCI